MFSFFVNDAFTNKHILNLSVGNHSMYVRRRKTDSLEVQQMKAKAATQRKFKLEQRSKLLHEMLAREQAEKRENEYQNEIQLLKMDVERKHLSLMEAQRTIQQLQEQLSELQTAKEQLELQQGELREMMERLTHSKNMEERERRKLEDEIRFKQEEVQRIQDEVEVRNEETRLLQQKIQEANQREEQMRMEQERLENERSKELEIVPEGSNVELPSLVEVNEQLKEDLMMLQQQLEQTRLENKQTELDKIHRDNVATGRDKYKTLNAIRKGNTVRRVDMFENM